MFEYTDIWFYDGTGDVSGLFFFPWQWIDWSFKQWYFSRPLFEQPSKDDKWNQRSSDL